MFLISGPDLVIACCRNGLVGTFPALNHRTTEGFEEWVIQIKAAIAEMDNPVGLDGYERDVEQAEPLGGDEGAVRLPF